MANQNYSTPEDVKREFISKMGSELGELVFAIRNDLLWLNMKWHEFNELFGKSESRIEYLNNSAPLFFNIIHNVMLYDIMLEIARLTDRPETSGNKNMTIQRIEALIAESEFRSELKNQINHAIECRKTILDWRNRRLSHRDLNLALSKNAKPLEFVSRKTVKEAILALNEVFQSIHYHYLGSGIYMKPTSSGLGGSEALLRVLRDGIEVRQEREERIKRGEYRESDLIKRSRKI